MDERILRSVYDFQGKQTEEKKQTGKKKKARGKIYRKKRGRLYKQCLWLAGLAEQKRKRR